MRMVDLILKKRNSEELTKEEIEWIIENYTNKVIPDYQVSAFLMATFLNGMTKSERLFLTKSIVKSGDIIDLSSIEGIKVDKHSTGGVGDKTTLVLAPLVASLGVPVAKMSGRGLGHTGGTLDKLEAIPNMKIELGMEDFVNQVNDKKIAVIGQTANLASADKLLYALRDVTATVESVPLIASSIMSKKIAAGSDAIVLDVKVGTGAFMKTIESAKELAEVMVEIGNGAGRKTTACITSMAEPLGLAVGNALEVKEAIDTLQNKGPKDLVELVLELGSHMVVHAGAAKTYEEAKVLLKENIENGKGFEKLVDFVKAQGGDEKTVLNTSLLPSAKNVIEVISEEDGYIKDIDALAIGVGAMKLGAGRQTKEDIIDMAVGVVLNKKQADKVSKGDVLAYLHTNTNKYDEVYNEVKEAYNIVNQKVEKIKLIYDVVE